MTYVVTEACIRCKFTDCVEVCPVDCFYEGQNMVAINPDECIDCGVCEPECPAEAIVSGAAAHGEQWLQLNAEYSRKWPRITFSKLPPKHALSWVGVENKFRDHFSEQPGTGDENDD